MAPRVPAPLLSVSESGRRRRPSASSRRLLLSSSAGAILARQESRAPRGRRQAAPAPATRGERPGGANGGTSPGDTPSPLPPRPPGRSRARNPVVCPEAPVHEEKFVLWPRSWVLGRMAAAQSWQNPFICNIWRKLCDWISFYDRPLPSSTGVYPAMKVKMDWMTILCCLSLGIP
ncbi:hypothetical protein AV530_010398 [Patagioenas fasciata monilis]|uniref:Uncharacterized protein n=1 Tax=Patagioenas fasciata monilis TaxID=372326 RepID=A0A1V4KF28_PATFA|nr:hypothetical protein AV530_010398 [Patagioenas fasciata monilis]